MFHRCVARDDIISSWYFIYPLPQAMERPTRTLVIVGDQKTLENFSIEMKNRNDVREVYRHQRVENALVVILFDIRKAEVLYKELKASNILAYYTISKYEVPQEHDKCDESKNQGTVYITLRNNKNVDDNDFMRHLNTFGDIKEVKLSSGLIKCLEYYDTRSASRMREALNNKSYGGCSVSVRNVWDLNSKVRNEILNKVEGELHKAELPESKDKRVKLTTSKKGEMLPFTDIFDEFIVENLDLISENLR